MWLPLRYIQKPLQRHFRVVIKMEDITWWCQDLNFIFEWREQYTVLPRENNIISWSHRVTFLLCRQHSLPLTTVQKAEDDVKDILTSEDTKTHSGPVLQFIVGATFFQGLRSGKTTKWTLLVSSTPRSFRTVRERRRSTWEGSWRRSCLKALRHTWCGGSAPPGSWRHSSAWSIWRSLKGENELEKHQGDASS